MWEKHLSLDSYYNIDDNDKTMEMIIEQGEWPVGDKISKVEFGRVILKG